MNVFIDGQAGTTGMKLAERARASGRFELLTLSETERKSPKARRDALNDCDIAVLCLPDDAAREAVKMVTSKSVKVLDASVAHRVSPGWTYGFPELAPGQEALIREARYVTNPGCFATAAIALIRPLVDAGLLAPEAAITLHGVSGYSGGGTKLVQAFEENGPERVDANFYMYALGLQHKHLPEIVRHGGLARTPIFVPSVARYRQGMLVSLPLHLDTLKVPGDSCPLALVQQAYKRHYQDCENIWVRTSPPPAILDPEALNDTNVLEIFVVADPGNERMAAIARLDNLGKGSSGAAMANLELMAGSA